MSEITPDPLIIREVVGFFTTRQDFEQAINGLKKAGFSHADISILSSHQSIDAAFAEDNNDKSLRERLLPLLEELRYETPMVAAGLIALASGPTAAAVAALVAAGLGGMALRDVMQEITAEPQREDFVEALKAGKILLWVAVRDDLAEERAKQILTNAGAKSVHPHQHKRGDGPTLS